MQVVYAGGAAPAKTYEDIIARHPVDCVIFWGNALVNALQNMPALFCEERGIPYVSIWDDNPLRYLHLLAGLKHHARLLVIDSHVVTQLTRLGLPAGYFPIPYVPTPSPGAAPVTTGPDYALAGSVYDLDAVFGDFQHKQYLDGRQTALLNAFVAERAAGRRYLDVFDWLTRHLPGTDVTSHVFALLSNTMMFLQKTIERIELMRLLPPRTGRKMHVFGPGRMRQPPPGVELHPNLDRETLNALYRATQVNLCCTQWPAAAHLRLFQCAAAGGFILSEAREDAAAEFTPGIEADYYVSLEELADKTLFYLERPQARARIAAAAHRRFLADHTIPARAQRLGATLGDVMGRC